MRYGMTRHHPLMKRASFALIERGLIESASAVHFTSLAEQAEAEALGFKCRGVLIPLGIDLGGVAERRATNPNMTSTTLIYCLCRASIERRTSKAC